jgi:hypothetical protein
MTVGLQAAAMPNIWINHKRNSLWRTWQTQSAQTLSFKMRGGFHASRVAHERYG